MWEIKDGTKLIARGGDVYDFHAGAHFLSNPKEALQYAVFNLPQGDSIQPHIHKTRERQGEYPTHEFFIVLEGALEVVFYSEERIVLGHRVLYDGDFFCQHSGGHGFRTIARGTIFIEVKHGPFTTVEDDKEKF